MMPYVYIPPLMRPLADGQVIVEIEGNKVDDVLDNLDSLFPGFRERLCEGNQLKAGMRVAVDDQISQLGLLQRVQPESEIHFIPAVGGG